MLCPVNCDLYGKNQNPLIKYLVAFGVKLFEQNTLLNKMKCLGKKYNKLYTNHLLRTTTISLLDEEEFEAMHIMFISGYRVETRI